MIEEFQEGRHEGRTMSLAGQSTAG